jgi:hypothetical protein
MLLELTGSTKSDTLNSYENFVSLTTATSSYNFDSYFSHRFSNRQQFINKDIFRRQFDGYQSWY